MRVELDPTVYVAPGARITGEVSIGARSSVWFNTVVRGDSAPVSVGEETNLQDNTVVHVDEGLPARIGSRVTVGHRAIVHGCVIEDDCLIGMGSIVLSGARIGRGSLVAAGSLVLEGREVPPGSVVLGAPARIAGTTNDEHRGAIARGSAHYVELARSYRERGIVADEVTGTVGGRPRGNATAALSDPEWLDEWRAARDRLLSLLRRSEPPAGGSDSLLERVREWVECDRRLRQELARHRGEAT
jgi:carbonic anhydrase/acetyltransferase-like protein (isoleucine patch superfamily)